MASWWDTLRYKMKALLHILGLLTLWVFVVVLLGTEQNNTIMLHLDQVHTYQLQKQPLYYDGVTRPAINTAFQTQWTAADDTACYGLTNWTGNTGCKDKRNTLVTTTRQLMSCDSLRSAGCNCLNQVLSKIANDLSTVGVGNNSFTGVFLTTGKNLTGQQQNVLAAIEACRYLHHPSYVAAETNTGNTLIRRVGLLFLLSTMLTGNAVLYFIFPSGAREWYAALWRTLGIIIWPILGAAVPAFLESAASNIIMLIVLPPLLLLVWYELVLTSHHKVFFFHPYFFAVVLATSSVIALVENSVFDYDNITYEIWKSHMVSTLYFAIYWFNSKSEQLQMNREYFSPYYASPSQQESVFIAMVLAVLSLLSTAMAPYTSVAYTNYLLWIPLQFAVVAFLDILYLSQHDPQRTTKLPAWFIPDSVYMASGLILILKALVVIYYWRDYSVIWHAMYENVPTRSIQYNASYTWLTPTY